MTKLMVYSSLERMAPELRSPDFDIAERDKARNGKFIEYYEGIRSSSFCQRNRGDFFLQVAIAFLASNDLANGEAYLTNAQNYASGGRMRLKVNNQLSRLYLAKAAKAANLEDAWVLFVQAREIIEEQINTNMEREIEREYPFARAASYYDFLRRFSGHLSREQITDVLAAVTFVSEMIDELPPYLQKRSRVRRCEVAMNDIRRLFGVPMKKSQKD